MNILEKICEETIKRLVGVVFAIIAILLFVLWSAIPKTIWVTIDSKVPKIAVWALFGISVIVILLLIAYIIYLKWHVVKTMRAENATQGQVLQESENVQSILKSENQELRSTQSILQKQLTLTQKRTEQSESPAVLEDAQMQILILLFEEEEMWDCHIAEALNMKQQQAQYHICTLENARYISRYQEIPGYPPTIYKLEQKGREYLKRQGHL